MSEVIFEAGDVVTCVFFGDKEFVLEINSTSKKYPVGIITNNAIRYFTVNGKAYDSDTHPVLKLVRKKSKEREWIQVFRVACKNESFQLIKEFDSYDDAFYWIKKSGIPSWEYQIEKFYKVKE